MPPSRRARDRAKGLLRKVFETAQRCGVDILPRHFYSEIPNVAELRRDRRWQRPYSMVGVRGTDIDQQLEWLRRVCPPHLADLLPGLHLQRDAGVANGALGYGPVESDLLYCVIRTLRPRRIVQVGAGASTWVALKAAADEGYALDVTCIDPYPTDFLTRLADSGAITLHRKPVQDIGADELADLDPGDVLFVDSTHTVSTGSDVNYLILEVFPRLRSGTLIHLHDVTMPYDYMPYVLSSDLFFWTESVLLHAYLADNPRVEIRAACAMLHDAALADVQAILPTYEHPMTTYRGLAEASADGAFPSSMWLEVVADPPPR